MIGIVKVCKITVLCLMQTICTTAHSIKYLVNVLIYPRCIIGTIFLLAVFSKTD